MIRIGSKNHPDWFFGNRRGFRTIQALVSSAFQIAQRERILSGLYVGVSGEDVCNPDGTSRQDEIRRCLPGEPVRLLPREDENGCVYVDVFSARNKHLGEIFGSSADAILEQIEAGEEVAAIVNGIHGHGGPNRRIVLLVGSVANAERTKLSFWPLLSRFAR